MKPFFFNGSLRQFIGAVMIFFGCIGDAFAQPLFYSAQQRLAMASGLRSASVHPFSAAVNPAAIASSTAVSWAVGGEQRFLAPGWMELAAAVVLPGREDAWGVFFGQEGLPFSFDQLLMVTYARTILEQVSVGASIGVNRKKVTSATAHIMPAAAVGVILPISAVLKTGISYTRFSTRTSKVEENSGLSFLRCLLAYEPTEKINLVAALSKESNWPAAGFFSVQYRPLQRIGFSAGFSGFPSLCWIGFQLGIGATVSLQLHSGFYQLTGLSNGMSLVKSADQKKGDGP
ncbi:MAG: hypothetical protein EB101_06125 [Chitinophagia bacterium]|nr:hypothetical protein [Chitinophagia bacterium]